MSDNRYPTLPDALVLGDEIVGIYLNRIDSKERLLTTISCTWDRPLAALDQWLRMAFTSVDAWNRSSEDDYWLTVEQTCGWEHECTLTKRQFQFLKKKLGLKYDDATNAMLGKN